jgi:hypothetical protein
MTPEEVQHINTVLFNLEKAIENRTKLLSKLEDVSQNLEDLELEYIQTPNIPSTPQLIDYPDHKEREEELRARWNDLGVLFVFKFTELRMQHLQDIVQKQKELLALLDKNPANLSDLEVQYDDTTYQADIARQTRPIYASDEHEKDTENLLRLQLAELNDRLKAKISPLRQKASIQRLQNLVLRREELLNLLHEKPTNLNDLRKKFNQTAYDTSTIEDNKLRNEFEKLGYQFDDEFHLLREEENASGEKKKNATLKR